MPIEVKLLEYQPYAVGKCPNCKKIFTPFLRGQVQRSERFLRILWRRPYCAIICYKCKKIIGWESPEQNLTVRGRNG